MALTPLASEVRKFMAKHGGITAELAFDHLGKLSSGSLSRRITELRDEGYDVRSEQKRSPINGRLYTRYALTGLVVHQEG